MTEENQGTSGMQNPNPQQTGQGMQNPPPDQSGQHDKYHGVSREEIIRKYESLEGQNRELSEKARVAGEFLQKVSPFFHFKEDGVDINDDAWEAWARNRGKLENTQNQPANQRNNPLMNDNNQTGSDSFMEQFENDPKGTIERMVEERAQRLVEERLNQNVMPHLKEFWSDRHNVWIEKMQNKYDDFDQWFPKIREYAKSKGREINSLTDLDEAYRTTKALHDGYVDKREFEKANQDLMKAMQIINPNAGMPRFSDPNASTEDLLGLKDLNTEKGSSIQALFGKSALKP